MLVGQIAPWGIETGLGLNLLAVCYDGLSPEVDEERFDGFVFAADVLLLLLFGVL